MSIPIQKAEQIVFYSNMSADIHMWCERKNSNGFIERNDYNLSSFISIKKTNKIIYKPLSIEENKKAWKIIYKKIIKPRLNIINSLTEEKQEEVIQTLINTPGQCIMRSYFIAKQSKDKWKIKIGSLGFKQSDGTIFWEYG